MSEGVHILGIDRKCLFEFCQSPLWIRGAMNNFTLHVDGRQVRIELDRLVQLRHGALVVS